MKLSLTVRARLGALAAVLLVIPAVSHWPLRAGLDQTSGAHQRQVEQRSRADRFESLEAAHAGYHRLGWSALFAALAREPDAAERALKDLPEARRALEERIAGVATLDPALAATLRGELQTVPGELARAVQAARSGDSRTVLRLAGDRHRRITPGTTLLRAAVEREQRAALLAARAAREHSVELLRLDALFAVVGIALCVMFALLAMRSVVQPLERAVRAVRQINAGAPIVDMPPEGADEFGAMAGVLRQFREQTAHLKEMAYTDALTGVASRARLDEVLHDAVTRTGKLGGALALLFLDVDNFRAVNESLGHSAGDQFLREAARRLQRAAPPDALLCRYSGDKFVLLLQRLRNDDLLQPALRGHAERMLRAVSEPFQVSGQPVHVSVSIGIAAFPRDGATAEQLVANADAAMYLAKRSGRNNAQFANPALTEGARQALTISNDVRRGLAAGEFEPFYQPIVNVLTRETVGAEALIRWRHPQRGLVMPGDFIRVAEQTGLVGALGEQLLERVCENSARFSARGLHLPISVNLSVRQLHDRALVQRIEELDRRLGIDPAMVSFEITESAMMENAERSLEVLQEIKSLGHKLCIDDFGTGYSSLSYLQRFPIDRLKLDRSFIAKIETSRHAHAIVSATLTLAHSLGLEIVAEGVETAAQMLRLKELGCELQQGFYYTAALPAQEIVAWAGERQAAEKLRVLAG